MRPLHLQWDWLLIALPSWYDSYLLDTDKKESFKDLDRLEFENESDAPLYIIKTIYNLHDSPISYNERILSVCANVSRHNCSHTQFINLLNLHGPANKLEERDINKVKAVCGFDKDHFYCDM